VSQLSTHQSRLVPFRIKIHSFNFLSASLLLLLLRFFRIKKIGVVVTHNQ